MQNLFSRKFQTEHYSIKLKRQSDHTSSLVSILGASKLNFGVNLRYYYDREKSNYDSHAPHAFRM